MQAIGDFLGISQVETIGFPHYLAAFEIVQSPNSVPDILKNNADSFVEIIENLEMKYIVNEQNQVVKDPYYARRRPVRDISSSINHEADKTDEKDEQAKYFMLRMAWQMMKA